MNLNVNIGPLIEKITDYIDENMDSIVEESRSKLSQYIQTHPASGSHDTGTMFNIVAGYNSAAYSHIDTANLVSAVNEVVEQYCKKALEELRSYTPVYVNDVENGLKQIYKSEDFVTNLINWNKSSHVLTNRVYDIVNELKSSY